ncbi:MAG: ABC transporter ATP-binding protein [Planctomycetota bacterium]|nr:ABC transporter ATP-binding protein [Planctomycetota bacterium]
MPLVETQNLSKQFGAITALRDCSIDIPQGTIFGLLGPNGAGKSTFIRLLMGMMKPTSGTATIGGLNCHSKSLQVRKQISYLPGDVRLDRHYKGRDLLRIMTSIRKDGSFQQATDIADFLALDLSRRVRSMSTGMRQKLALTLALSNQAPLIILDEPTSNLDPTVRQQVIELLQRRKQTGQTILFSSHILDEVETVCDQVAILKDGQLALTEKISAIRQTHRLHARIPLPLPPPPKDLEKQISVSYPKLDNNDDQEQIIIEIQGDLQPAFEWLSQVALKNVTIEPSRLRSL